MSRLINVSSVLNRFRREPDIIIVRGLADDSVPTLGHLMQNHIEEVNAPGVLIEILFASQSNPLALAHLSYFKERFERQPGLQTPGCDLSLCLSDLNLDPDSSPILTDIIEGRWVLWPGWCQDEMASFVTANRQSSNHPSPMFLRAISNITVLIAVEWQKTEEPDRRRSLANLHFNLSRFIWQEENAFDNLVKTRLLS